MKLYLVTDGCYSNYHLIGIFDNKQLAENAKLLFNAKNDIYEWELNTSIASYYDVNSFDKKLMDCINVDLLPYRVHMSKNGDSVVERISIEDYFISQDKDVPWSPVYPTQGLYLREKQKQFAKESFIIEVICLAKNEEHAIKITNEKRSQIIAENLWGISIREYIKLFYKDDKKIKALDALDWGENYEKEHPRTGDYVLEDEDETSSSASSASSED